MKRGTLLKRLVSFVTALVVVLMPVSAMAAEVASETEVVETEASVMPRQYMNIQKEAG
ncbi:MAG: hypothetical protein Q4F11_07485 [Eubacteriales bacterium]|nr:hypothetical protein [Eubacteriales bacterium]